MVRCHNPSDNVCRVDVRTCAACDCGAMHTNCDRRAQIDKIIDGGSDDGVQRTEAEQRERIGREGDKRVSGDPKDRRD